jgi:CrcB protein
MRLALVLAGGALGSAARYLLSTWMAGRLGPAFPWGTLAVNILGSFVIGLVATLADEAGGIGPQARLLLVPGVLGGFTTFSSFSLETLRLVEDGEVVHAALYVLGSIAAGLVAAALGVAAGRALTPA